MTQTKTKIIKSADWYIKVQISLCDFSVFFFNFDASGVLVGFPVVRMGGGGKGYMVLFLGVTNMARTVDIYMTSHIPVCNRYLTGYGPANI